MSTSPALVVVAIACGGIAGADLVGLAESAFDVLLTHAGNDPLIDDRYAAFLRAEQISTFALGLANDRWLPPLNFRT